MQPNDQPTLELAERVASAARELGIETAADILEQLVRDADLILEADR